MMLKSKEVIDWLERIGCKACNFTCVKCEFKVVVLGDDCECECERREGGVINIWSRVLYWDIISFVSFINANSLIK